MRLLKFGAPWCGQCKVLGKQLENFDTCEIVSYDVEDENNEELVEKFNIRNLPLLVLVDDNGNEIKRWHGLVNVNKLKEDIIGLK